MWKHPCWKPIAVTIDHAERIIIYCRKFEDGEAVRDPKNIYVKRVPPGAKMTIDIEGDEEHAPERYVVYNSATSKAKKAMRLVIEEYQGDMLQRTCKVGHDEHGYYEMITEA